MTRRLRIKWESGDKVTARLEVPTHDRGIGVLLAHGAGAGQDHPFMVALRGALAAGGVTAMTFNYAYTESGRKAPDRLPKLLEVHRAAAARLATYCDRVYLGGKSMGGRVGSHLAAEEGWVSSGAVYYGYPLVPVGKSEPRDTSHLDRIDAPQLFFAGTRDRLSPPALIVPLVGRIAAATAVIIGGGDHSFNVPKRTGRIQQDVIEELAAHTLAWIG